MEGRIRDLLKERGDNGLLRSLETIVPGPGYMIRSGGREYSNFSSNDYLGLSGHPGIKEAASAAGMVFGSGSSRLITGTTHIHDSLERDIAVFKGKEAALIFNSGYQANIGIISALCGPGDCVFVDRLIHASIIDGIRLSGARLVRFRHNDTRHLATRLTSERKKYREALVITESVFSMDGDIAPLEEIASLCKDHRCLFMVDEAHATGVFGDDGGGLTSSAGMAEKVDIIMGTFSKALGAFGAFAALSRDMRSYMVNACRGFIYSTSLPLPVVAAAAKALELVREEPWRREKLAYNARYMKERLAGAGFTTPGMSQILPVITGDPAMAVELSRGMREKGWWLYPVRYPAVPFGSSRVRVSLTAMHDKDVIDKFMEDLIPAADAAGKEIRGL